MSAAMQFFSGPLALIAFSFYKKAILTVYF